MRKNGKRTGPRVEVMSVYDAFDYCMDHYYPAGMEEEAPRKDPYAVISIQDTHTEGFGFRFAESKACKGVLTLYFDDVEAPVEGAVLFSGAQAKQILDFIAGHKTDAETLLIHCYGGESRSRAVGAFAEYILGGNPARFTETGHPNRHVYETLESVWLDGLIGP